MEGYCAGALAATRKPDQLDRLDQELARQQAIIASGDQLAWVRANMDFHIYLVGSLNNALFNEWMVPLASHTMRIGFRMNARRARMEESLQEHSAVVEAIRRRDPDRARALASKHLYVTTVLMKQLFNDIGLMEK